MKRLLSVVVALVTFVLLSSCALVPTAVRHIFTSDFQQADTQMGLIAAAVNGHDVAGLKALFSARAVQDATDLDSRLDGLFSAFPNGGLTWERATVNSEADNEYGRITELLHAYYKVFADGKDYMLFFADYPFNDVIDPDNVGIYGLGVTPWYEGNDQGIGAAQSFSIWASAMSLDESDKSAYPGIYVGYDNSQTSLHALNQIVSELNTRDIEWLQESFTKNARSEQTTEINDGITALIAFFPQGDVVAQDQQAAPTVRETTDSTGRRLMLLSSYRVSAEGVQYWLFCADFRENPDPNDVGIQAIGVAPWTASGDSAAEQALFSWGDTFDVHASTPPGIFISQ